MKTWIPPTREFSSLTWKQVEAISRDTLLVIPTAAIEQHGHHLPLATDTLINNLLLGHALAKLPDDAPIFALPPVCYGKSNEHIGFPGTMSVSSSTFMAILHDLGASIKASGFKRVVIFNTHGGNTALIDVMARDLRAEFDLQTFFISGSAGAKFTGLNPQEAKYGFHAGELETAWLLAATPELVHPTEYTTNYIADINDPALLVPENGPAVFSWLTRDISSTGVLGDPTPSTAENGTLWIDEASTQIAKALAAILAHKGPPPA